jgi:DNA polymerase-3 subunit gamma/tau
LEEPPAHVIFILATTEKHKILPTILSRCQIYDFERMTVRDTINHLKQVAEKEGITVEEEALAVIAEKADGGMRDALSIFDQAASFCQGNITYQKVIEDLNVLDADNYFRIVDLALENKAMDIMVLLNNVINKGFDGGLLIQGLAKHVRNVLMARDAQTLPLLEVSDQQRQRYQQQAQKCQIPFLYQALRLINQCDINYRQSSNKRLLVELTLIEIAQITQPDDSVGSGRKPRRLKSLFKQLTQSVQPQKAAPQVAAAERVVSSKTSDTNSSSENSHSSTSPTSTPSQSASKRPTLKSAVSMSFKNILEKSKPKKMTVIPGTFDASDPNATPKDEEHSFSQQDLELQWMLMCNRMPQKLSGIATRMKNMNPIITDFPNVEVTADNQVAFDQLEQIKGSIIATLKTYLHNKAITLSLRLADKEEIAPILSRREQYEMMEKENPSIAKLRELLSLELA